MPELVNVHRAVPADVHRPAPETLAMIYLVLGPDGTIRSGNRSATRLMFRGRRSIGFPSFGPTALSDLVHQNAVDAVEAAISGLHAGSARVELVAQLAAGPAPATDAYVHLVLSRHDTPSSGPAIVVQGWDVTALMQRVRALEVHAFHDSLTGIANRSTFMDRLQHEVNRSARTGTDMAVMYADIDGFKAVNDRYGHETGDHVLVHVSRRLTECLRPADTLARLGGDEFAVICPDIGSREQAMTIADRLTDAAAEPLTVRHRQFCVTLSVGVAFAVEHGHEDPAAALLRCADDAMYEAKRARRRTR